MSAKRSLAAFAMAGATLAGLPAATAAEPVEIYVVRKGDTLFELGERYWLNADSYRIVQRQNQVINPRRLSVGRKLKVPARLLRTEPIKVRLGAFRGAVTVTANGRPLPTSQGASLGEGATVATGPNAFARLDLPDGSKIALPSQSRIRLDRLRMTLMTGAVDRAFTVEGGRSESTVTPLAKPKDRYIVRTPMSVSAVRGTDFRVTYSPDTNRATTEVVSGAVAVNGATQTAALAPARFGVSATTDGVSALKPLLSEPKLLRPDQVQDEKILTFDVAPAAGEQSYRAVIAEDAGFLGVVAESTAQAPRLTFDALGNGMFFVKLTALSADGLEGMPATYAFERTLNTLELQAPVASGGARQKRFLFRWEAGGEGIRTFRFQLYRKDQTAAPLVDETGLTTEQMTVTDLPPGVYGWRVMSRTFLNGRIIEKWSPPQDFHLGA